MGTPDFIDNNYSWQTLEFRSEVGSQSIAVFVFELVDAPVRLSLEGVTSSFLPALLEGGFVVQRDSRLEVIVPGAPRVSNPKVRFDLRSSDQGVLYAPVNGIVEEVVSAPIGNVDEVDRPFREAAAATGEVLVIAGERLNIDPATGSYDLTRATLLTAGYVPAQQ